MQAKLPANARIGLGRRGETLAAAELIRQGYRVVERNWRCPAGEVDIVACRDNGWSFFEVRTRRGDEFGTPEESLGEAKRERMLQVALTYLVEHGYNPYDVNWRVGLVAVEMDRAGRLLRVEVYESIE
ncbi:MAG: YraN family protein [Anaerolineae bacterium]|nr:YraN family protein [Anaerolineae bacterium]